MKNDMKNYLENINLEKVEKMTAIKKNYIEGLVDFETAKAEILQTFNTITPEEFAYSEQKMKEMGYTDMEMHEKMNSLIELFRNKIVQKEEELPKGHPIKTYIEENDAIKKLIKEIEIKTKKYSIDKKFIKNEWLEIYDKLYQFNTHLSRKQHQLFSMLEKKGFDRPSRIMWTFDNAVRDNINSAIRMLNEENVDEKAFFEQQSIAIELTLDIMDKEEQILYPTSLKLISEEEFRKMRKGDDEIGYCLIERPTDFYFIDKEEETIKEKIIENKAENVSGNNFITDLAGLLQKYGMTGNKEESKSNENLETKIFDVKQGKLTLEQINLIFQHMPVDLSYVDENDLVKFYSDTKHRVFPRSAGVIGRNVKNCHPAESVDSVMEIIDNFRNGKQDEIDFWIQTPKGDFIYIYYVAVRDEKGKFRGVLEMMQNATKIRSLTGQRKIVTWENEKKIFEKDNEKIKQVEEKSQENSILMKKENYGLTKDTVIGDIVEKYPYIREFMPTVSSEYKKITNPIHFAIMKKVARLDMIAAKGGFTVDELIKIIADKIHETENTKN